MSLLTNLFEEDEFFLFFFVVDSFYLFNAIECFNKFWASGSEQRRIQNCRISVKVTENQVFVTGTVTLNTKLVWIPELSMILKCNAQIASRCPDAELLDQRILVELSSGLLYFWWRGLGCGGEDTASTSHTEDLATAQLQCSNLDTKICHQKEPKKKKKSLGFVFFLFGLFLYFFFFDFSDFWFLILFLFFALVFVSYCFLLFDLCFRLFLFSSNSHCSAYLATAQLRVGDKKIFFSFFFFVVSC